MADERMYSLDTSFFMDWQARYYPVDVFASLEKKIEGMIAANACRAVQLVREEIDAVATPGLRAWARSHSGLFVPMTAEIQIEGAAIAAKYPDLMDQKAAYESADAYVIALAKLNEGIVVSQETSVQEKRGDRFCFLRSAGQDNRSHGRRSSTQRSLSIQMVVITGSNAEIVA